MNIVGFESVIQFLSSIDFINNVVLSLSKNPFIANFTNIIEYTYTLIVGFVAIGIPLAIQISGQSSEKYDNTLLAKRLTQGVFVNPVNLIVISVLYITLSLYLNLAVTDTESDLLVIPSDQALIIKSILFLLFFITLISAGWFYIRLYFRSLTKTEKYINNFLMLENTLFLTSLEYVNSKRQSKLLSLWIERFRRRRFSESDMLSINAGLEVLIEQLKSKSWESEFIEILFLFHKKVRKVYFGDYKEVVAPLCKSDVKLIKMYWDALIRIIRLSREAEDAKLSFHSQRLLAEVVSYIVHHPQYDLLVAESYSIISDNKINWTSDVYEIARWQGHQSGKGIDLVIECEWFGNVFGIMRDIDFKNGTKGTVAASRLVIDILYNIASEHPNKIISLFKNISANLYGDTRQGYYFTWPDDESMKWISEFWDDFNNIEFSLKNIDTLDDMLLSLSDGRAYVKYGSYPLSQPLNKAEIEKANEAIKLDEIYESIFLKFIKSIGWEFSALLAFYSRWQEFYDCLEWKQPRETTAHHLGEAMLTTSVSELLELIRRDYNVINSHFRFHDRHEIGPYAFRAFLFQLCYLHERGDGIGLLYTSGSIDDGIIQKQILEKLLEQEKNIKGNIFSDTVMDSVCNVIRKSITSIDQRIQSDEKNKPIDSDKWTSLKNEIEQGWSDNFQLSSVLNVIYKGEILSHNCCLFRNKISRKYLVDCSERGVSGKHYGLSVANNIIQHLYNQFLDIARVGSLASLAIDCHLVFASKDKLIGLGFEASGINVWKHSRCPKSIAFTANSDQVLVVDSKKVMLELSSNPSSFDGENPLFSYLIDNNDSTIELIVDIFYEISLACDDGVIVA